MRYWVFWCLYIGSQNRQSWKRAWCGKKEGMTPHHRSLKSFGETLIAEVWVPKVPLKLIYFIFCNSIMIMNSNETLTTVLRRGAFCLFNFYCLNCFAKRYSIFIWASSCENLFMPYANNSRRRLASAQFDQCLYCLLLREIYIISSFYIWNFKTPARFCSWAGQFESYQLETLKTGFLMTRLIWCVFKFSWRWFC